MEILVKRKTPLMLNAIWKSKMEIPIELGMSYKWRLGLWLTSSALLIIGSQLKGWAEPLVSLCGIVLMLWPVLRAMTGRHSVLDKPISGWVGWLASGLALILFLGSVLLIAQPEQNRRARDLGWTLMLSAYGLILIWARPGKRQER
jgi:peptidoglycan/LPS O-acetylase OafA/YrhL